jgi:hypothetical protein
MTVRAGYFCNLCLYSGNNLDIFSVERKRSADENIFKKQDI